MSLPRAVVPGRTYMITRRCSERRFFLRPDRETNNAFVYCLAVAAHKYGVKVIFTATMSNHHHTGVLDADGRLPDFLAHFHKLIASTRTPSAVTGKRCGRPNRPPLLS